MPPFDSCCSDVIGSAISPSYASDIVLILVLVLLFLLLFCGILRFDVEDHLQSLLVHGHLTLQTGEVEVIFDEFFRDLGEVFMTNKRAESRDP
jgi:hypothetical protein